VSLTAAAAFALEQKLPHRKGLGPASLADFSDVIWINSRS
jgi:hypothetical protein